VVTKRAFERARCSLLVSLNIYPNVVTSTPVVTFDTKIIGQSSQFELLHVYRWHVKLQATHFKETGAEISAR
jgi:hypothetical protein